jgi:toxin ParE1/3/4
MSRRLILRPEAEEDVRQGYLWYEERQAGLGQRFITALDAALAAIQERPEAYHQVEGEVRRALAKRFPYGIFYVVEPQRIVVLAVLHTARDPQVWQARAGSSR